MNDLNDDQLDLLLREHFTAELDSQLGRAPDFDELSRAAAFAARSRRRLPPRAVKWFIGSGLALAAGIAALFALSPMFKVTQSTSSSDLGLPVTPAADSVEHQIAWNTIDQGTVFVNGDVPMRSIRRERVDSLKWTDPDTKAQMEMTVPHDEVVLVGMNAN